MRPPPPLDRVRRRLTQAWQSRGVTLKAASFAMVGVVNTFIDLGIFLASYDLLELPLIPANVLAWLVAVSCSYVMNSFITFAAESGRRLHWRAYGAFVALGAAGVITNTTIPGPGPLLATGPSGEIIGHPRELRSQFLAVAFRRVQDP
jgi:putative flippase GtrA